MVLYILLIVAVLLIGALIGVIVMLGLILKMLKEILHESILQTQNLRTIDSTQRSKLNEQTKLLQALVLYDRDKTKPNPT